MSVYSLKWQRTHPTCLPNEFCKIISNVSSLFKSLIMPMLPSVSYFLSFFFKKAKAIKFISSFLSHHRNLHLSSVSFPLIYLVQICKVLNFSFQEYIGLSVFCFLFHDIPCSARLGHGFYFILIFLRSMLACWLLAFYSPSKHFRLEILKQLQHLLYLACWMRYFL